MNNDPGLPNLGLALQMERAAAIGTVLPIGDTTFAVMTALETADGDPLIGNVIRRTCLAVGAQMCAQTCQLAALRGPASLAELKPETPDMLAAKGVDETTLLEQDPTACSDQNVLHTLAALGVRPEQALIVGVSVTEDKIGYLDDDRTRDSVTQNPHGWFEVPGFNAFFVRKTDALQHNSPDGAKPVQVLGNRLADSGSLVIEMVDRDGAPVIGMVHSTRTNMPGREHRTEYDGQQQSFVHYVLTDSMAHFGASPESVKIRMIAAVGPEAWAKRYTDAAKLESQLPGWAADGLVFNATTSEWVQPGTPISKQDKLLPQYPTKVRFEVEEAAAELGITDLQFEGSLDPGQPHGGKIHSSANRRRVDPDTPPRDTRDLYAAVFA